MHSYQLAETLEQLNLDVPSFRPVARAFILDVTECLADLERAAVAVDYASIVQSAQALERVARVMHAGALVQVASQIAANAQAENLERITESLGHIRAKTRGESDLLWTIAGHE